MMCRREEMRERSEVLSGRHERRTEKSEGPEFRIESVDSRMN